MADAAASLRVSPARPFHLLLLKAGHAQDLVREVLLASRRWWKVRSWLGSERRIVDAESRDPFCRHPWSRVRWRERFARVLGSVRTCLLFLQEVEMAPQPAEEWETAIQ